MKRLKGPELKLSGLRAPDFLVDLYWDLRDRRLLPLVALGLVAIVAVPFLLSGGSDEEAPEAGAGALQATQEASSGGAELTVVKATPVLRDYRRRLRDRSPSDPFRQQYTAPEGGGATSAPSPSTTSSTSSLGSTTTSSSSETTSGDGSTTTNTTKTTESSPGGSTTTETTTRETHTVVPASEGKDGGQNQLTLYSFAIDVKVVRTASTPEGSKEKGEAQTRERVLAPAPLPGPKTQVATYMGISPTSRQPLLLISDQVTGTFGEGKCLSGASTCQLLEVEVGMPITFVYGPDGARYKITVLKVEPVVTGHS
ncbi:MAG TPA: hypothetical protein VHA54_03580 [Solirubrobacterales bacterium]|nr:hypothetical protein [Solirubrobacterales bacterium]